MISKFDMKKMIRWKVYFDRSRMYIGYIQFFSKSNPVLMDIQKSLNDLQAQVEDLKGL